MSGFTWRGGGCHCGAVRFEAALPDVIEAQSCNCSICERTGFIHIIVPPSRFRLKEGQAALTSYRFNTGVADHLFCLVCGVKSFYRPRSNPDGWSVNARCLDDADALDIRIHPFDGRNWEANAAALAHLSQEAHQ
ncbi:MAG TPA: GFA family protein [Caulobacteraceae bacterium]|nr:GFA family protein [Caulobacteraceae bacterium]